MEIRPKPNKLDTRKDLQRFILAHCDEDIAMIFEPHGFFLEPLLLQLVREFHLLRVGESERADYERAIERAFRSLGGPAERNYADGREADGR
jgi:hypothetical protein